MREVILEKLQRIERARGIKILYACESGSRAWGFASPDSDYDVRFIYAHPLDWYLSVSERRDVIEYPIDESLDVSGWDLRKALRLLAKSNPPLLEWLGSPIVYQETPAIVAKLRNLAHAFYEPVSCSYHYLHMARGNYREYLSGPEVWTKKYFYVLRPLLAMQWIEHGYGVVPTEFSVLVDQLLPSGELRRAIDELLALKCAGAELRWGPRNEVIDRFIRAEFDRWAHSSFERAQLNLSLPELDNFFQWVVKGRE